MFVALRPKPQLHCLAKTKCTEVAFVARVRNDSFRRPTHEISCWSKWRKTEKLRKSTLHSCSSILSTLPPRSLPPSLSLCIYIYNIYIYIYVYIFKTARLNFAALPWNEGTNSTYSCMMLTCKFIPS